MTLSRSKTRPGKDAETAKTKRSSASLRVRRLLQVPSLSDQVRMHLLTEMTSGRLQPGDRINEAEMSRSLGISRNPIREAVSGLAQRGFLLSAQRRGHFLRRFTMEDVNDVYAFRICVETFALREAMPRMSEADMQGFDRLFKRMVAAATAGRLGELQQMDMLFHRRICELSGSRRVLWAHEGIDTEVQMLMALVDLGQESAMETALVHQPIARAIASGNVAQSVAALEDHLRNAWANVVAKCEDIGSAKRRAARQKDPKLALTRG